MVAVVIPAILRRRALACAFDPSSRAIDGPSATPVDIGTEQIPVLVAPDRHGATTDAMLPKLNRLSITAALDGIVTPANEFCCDGGTAIVAFPSAAIPSAGADGTSHGEF